MRKPRAIFVPGFVVMIKELKEQIPAATMPPLLLALRDHRTAAMVLADQVDRDRGLSVAAILRTGFDPDALVFACEVFGKNDRRPDERWPPGHLQRLAETGATDVWEALYIMHCDRAGAMEQWNLTFQHAGTAGLQWTDIREASIAATEERHDILATTLRGIMTDAHGRAKNFVESVMPVAQEMKLDEKTASYHLSRAVLVHLEREGCECWDLRPLPPGYDGHRLRHDIAGDQP
jgi:hypothetical protein